MAIYEKSGAKGKKTTPPQRGADGETDGTGAFNVHSGPGSKGKGSKTGHVKVAGPSDAAFRGDDSGATATEKTHNVDFAEGGTTKMFGLQEAGSRMHDDNSPSTGKPDSSGPGEAYASGGKGKMFGFNPSVPAQAGITSAR